MANICSISLNLGFRYKKDKEAFIKDFQKKIDVAESRNEGIKIASSKWFFDADIEDDTDKSLSVLGSVRWCLESEAMAEWHKYFKKMKVKEYTCYYEETGNQVYGKYVFEDGELWDHYIADTNPIWQKAYDGEDSYFDDLEHALDNDAVMEQVA